MGIIGILIAAAVAFAAAEGRAQDPSCGCALLPFEGTYDLPDGFHLTLDYLDGDRDSCPTRLHLRAPRPDAPDADVVLSCPVGGAVWRGQEKTRMGWFTWELRADRPSLPEARAETSEALAPAQHLTSTPGMATARTLEVGLGLPTVLHGIGKRDRVFPASLRSPARAPACLCERVRLALEHVGSLRRHYADKKLIARAERRGLRGKKAAAEFWMDSKHRLHRFGAGSPAQHSYDDLVTNLASGDVSRSELDSGMAPQIDSAAAAKAGQRSLGGLDPGAYAQVDPVNCKISLPSPAAVRRSCEPPIVLLAALRHEEQHARRCRALNRPSTYSLEGKTLDWQRDQDPVTGILLHQNEAMPESGYSAWSQKPAHQGADEAASYAIEERMLQTYRNRYCGS